MSVVKLSLSIPEDDYSNMALHITTPHTPEVVLEIPATARCGADHKPIGTDIAKSSGTADSATRADTENDNYVLGGYAGI